MLTQDRPAFIIKVTLLGEGGVGKTCIARRLCFDSFDADTKLTIGLEFYTYNLPILIDNKEHYVRLSIWDFGGQAQFRNLFHYYIKGSNGIMMVFDLTNNQTLINLEWWYDKLREYDQLNVPRVVIGAKEDLIEGTDNNKINRLVIERFLEKHGEQDYFKTSSKEDVNILSSFKELTNKILTENDLDFDKLL